MDHDKRRHRLRFQSWHRGTHEMDLLMGRFADAHLAGFSDRQLAEYEAILRIGDPDLFNWITGCAPLPSEHESDVMRLLSAYAQASYTRGTDRQSLKSGG